MATVVIVGKSQGFATVNVHTYILTKSLNISRYVLL